MANINCNLIATQIITNPNAGGAFVGNAAQTIFTITLPAETLNVNVSGSVANVNGNITGVFLAPMNNVAINISSSTNTINLNVQPFSGGFSYTSIPFRGIQVVNQTLATLLFNYSTFANSSGLHVEANHSEIDGSNLVLVLANSGHTGGAVWYTTLVDISKGFTTYFTFHVDPNSTSAITGGMAFVVQNTTSPPDAEGFVGIFYLGDANCDGYGVYDTQPNPINSIAIKFDLCHFDQNSFPVATSTGPSSTGLYVNGGPFAGLVPCNDMIPYGIDLYNGHVFSGVIVYDGSTITLVLADQTTGAQIRQTWPVNIPYACSGNLNYVGLTVGTVSNAQFSVNTWSFYSGYNTRLATPTFSPTPGQYGSTQNVTINEPAGSNIYYTTNGLEPTSASTQYTGTPISVSTSTILKAVAIQNNYTDSFVGTAQYQIGTANLINFTSGFAANDGVILVGSTVLNGANILLTDNNTSIQHEVGSAWFGDIVSVNAFTTHFQLKFTNISGGSLVGMTFCIQNNPSAYTSNNTNPSWPGGPNVYGPQAGAYGYGTNTGTDAGSPGILQSIAVIFNVTNSNVGLYLDGTSNVSAELPITGITLSSGHTMNVALTYSGTNLSFSITDTNTTTNFSHNWTIDIPGTVGGNTAYVGFTGADGYSDGNQMIQSWTYSSP